MSKKMLIDASHPEETRVVIVNGSRIDELDFESENKRQLRGNVYLARVTRVEPSLQAAFVEYGGNRHGFLAFSEIHPDYYQIPYEDRMALLEAEEAENIAEDEEAEKEDAPKAEDTADDVDADDGEASESDDEDDDAEDTDAEAEGEDEDVVEEQAKISSSRRKRMSRRRYKIQEVIKRGQILLIQVVKEERGNKGAAMTTYLSMAGRYCVLMPNTPRGGGISRKIANGADRKRLKSVVSEFEVPQGMGVIVRTAGAKRTKIEIKRDYDYLCRLWETTRETTLKSIAPALIHEEGNLVKRSIRDLYNKDISEILVQGDEAYKTAKSFIKMLMPSHAKNVKAYKDNIPLFLRYQVEKQLENSLDSVVQLKSGGYLVIHPTEALVSVDVNSGRSTKERNVERTALKTNLEAADEVARQMRLRDLAGLIVIDFIDMDENRNNRAVEKRMKDALAQDRARVQNSRITQFGLMEISRQRRRRSLLEGSTAHCEHCQGVGRKRTVESSALAAIRAIEEVGARGQARRIRVTVAPDVLLYLINDKRDLMNDIDARYQMFTVIVADDTLIRPQYTLDILETGEAKTEDPLAAIEKEAKEQDRKSEQQPKRKGRRKDKDDDAEDDNQETPESSDDDDEESGSGKRRRRRGRRGGRRRKPEGEENSSENSEENTSSNDDALEVIEPKEDEKPKRGRRRKSSKKEDAETSDENEDDSKPKRRRRKSSKDAPEAEASETETSTEEKSDDKPRSTTRRKAPSRKPKPEAEVEVADTKSDESPKSEPEARDTKPADDTPKSTTRRKAPSRKKKAEAEPEAEATPNEDTSSKDDAEPAKAAASESKPKSTARRKAPARKKAPESKPESKPKTKPKSKAKPKPEPEAPAEDTAAKTEESDDTTDASKSARSTARRKAPARKKAPAKKPAAKKAPAKKAKPAKKETEVETKSDDKAEDTPSEEAPKAPRSTARRKAPSRAKKADDTPKTDDTPDASEAAPEESSRKAAAHAPVTKTEPVPEEKPAKRGWFRRKKKD